MDHRASLPITVAIISLLIVSSAGMVLAEEQAEPEDILGKVTSIVIVGNDTVPRNDILAVSGIATGDEVSETDLNEAAQAVFDLGYFQYVEPRIGEFYGGLRLTIEVFEWPIYRGTVLQGDTIFAEEEIIEVLALEEGKAINRDRLMALLEFYQEEGYVVQYRNLELSPDDGLLYLDIEPAVINSIQITGHEKTKYNVIAREVEVQAGDYLDMNAINEDLRRIYNLRAFEDVLRHL